MNFLIEIRHIESGLAKTFVDLQEVANFLADKVHAEWEGFHHLGPLPAPTVEAAPAAEAPAAEVVQPAAEPAPEPAAQAPDAPAAEAAPAQDPQP